MQSPGNHTRRCFALAAGAAILGLPPPPAAYAADADSLLIVDCLLPGRVQRLGTAATYMTARQAIRTSAAQCRARGGEYTAAGEATYASLMRIWLPLAKGGNTEAQTNLGEIFEKGLGGAPQYELAAQWYRLAAESGYPRAQVNLGSLYERGVGVPRDMGQALSWYRRASGLDLPLGGASSAEVSRLQQERNSLEQQLAAERRRREDLETELESVRRRLSSERSSLSQEQRQLDEARRELESRRQALDEQRSRIASAPAAAPDPGLARLQSQLDEQRRRVADRDAQLSRLQTSVAQLEARSQTLQASLADTQRQNASALAAARDDASSARLELTAVSERLRRATDELRARQARMSEQGAEVERLRHELTQHRSDASEKAGRAALEAKLREREAELEESRRRLASLSAEVTRLGDQTRSSQQAAATASPAALRVPRDVNFGRYFALVIGNNNYRFIPRLKTAAGDARAIAEVLRNRYGFQTTLLLEADRYQMLSALNRLREVMTSDDNLLIYYAGHGTVDENSNRDYWLPVDAESDSTANWIPSYQVTDFLKAIAARHIMLVADSCYSGMLTRSAITRLDTGMTDDERVSWYQAMIKKQARVILTSGGNKPVLDGGGGVHSVFAAALLAVLQNNTEVLEGQRLAQEVTKRVTVRTAAINFDQVPIYAPLSFAGHEAGDFFFVPN